eukprot:TCONS_00038001-protein
MIQSGVIILLLASVAVTCINGLDNKEATEECRLMIEKTRERFNENQDMMENTIEYVCKQMGRKKCEHRLKKKFSMFLNPEKFDATKFCGTMTQTLQIVGEYTKQFRKCEEGKPCPFLCKTCKSMVTYVTYAIKVLNMTSEQVKGEMESYCKVLSPALIDENLCKTTVDHMEEIVQQILQEVTPGNICVELKVCNGTVQSMEDKVREIFKKGGHKIFKGFRHQVKKMMKNFADKMTTDPSVSFANAMERHQQMMKKFQKKFFQGHGKPVFPNFFDHEKWGLKRKHHFKNRWNKVRQEVREGMESHRKNFKNMFGRLHKVGNFGFGKFGKMFGGAQEENEETKEPMEQTTKPGRCPGFMSKACFKVRPEAVCTGDEDCSGDQKCCQTGCVAKICAKPEEEKEIEPEIIDETSEVNDNEDGVITDNNDINVPTIETDEKNVVFKDEGEPKSRERRSIFDHIGDTFDTSSFTDFMDDGDNNEDDELSPEEMDIETPEDWYNPSEFDGDTSGVIEGLSGKGLEYLKEPFDGSWMTDDEEEEEDELKFKPPKVPFGNLFGGFGTLFSTGLPKSIEKKIDEAIEQATKGLDKVKEEIKNKNLTGLIPNVPGFPISAGFECSVCTVIVKVIEFEVKSVNASIEEIEKVVKGLCNLYPVQPAREACDKIVDEIDEIVQLIEKDVEVKDICITLGLCPNSTLSDKMQTVSFVTPNGDCDKMCSFWRALHNGDVDKTMRMWIEAKEQLVDMCEKSTFKKKCMKMLTTFEKAERQLGSVLTRDLTKQPIGEEAEEQEPITNEEVETTCKCFKKQPIFVTENFDRCQLCQQMQTGLMRDVMDAKISMEFLIAQMNKFCEGVPEENPKCKTIIKTFNTSFSQLESKLESRASFCSVIGYCQSEEDKSTMKEMMKQVFGNMGSFLPSLGLGIGGNPLDKESQCSFCSDCMKNIKNTLKNVTSTGMPEEDITPMLKDGFAIYCRSMKKGDVVEKVCKRIYNGMESIQRTIISTSSTRPTPSTTIETPTEENVAADDEFGLCKDFDMC